MKKEIKANEAINKLINNVSEMVNKEEKYLNHKINLTLIMVSNKCVFLRSILLNNDFIKLLTADKYIELTIKFNDLIENYYGLSDISNGYSKLEKLETIDNSLFDFVIDIRNILLDIGTKQLNLGNTNKEKINIDFKLEKISKIKHVNDDVIIEILDSANKLSIESSDKIQTEKAFIDFIQFGSFDGYKEDARKRLDIVDKNSLIVLMLKTSLKNYLMSYSSGDNELKKKFAYVLDIFNFDSIYEPLNVNSIMEHISNDSKLVLLLYDGLKEYFDSEKEKKDFSFVLELEDGIIRGNPIHKRVALIMSQFDSGYFDFNIKIKNYQYSKNRFNSKI